MDDNAVLAKNKGSHRLQHRYTRHSDGSLRACRSIRGSIAYGHSLRNVRPRSWKREVLEDGKKSGLGNLVEGFKVKSLILVRKPCSSPWRQPLDMAKKNTYGLQGLSTSASRASSKSPEVNVHPGFAVSAFQSHVLS